ncbi:hypothetical protein C6341_g11987 [Phytophthora cactorum]|nr:hypothetical protein PC120_g17632 [Phytophthora cactorum]KAG3166646.1 hypothetical protein C6341_g11987 [Phytophthora cactorum]
MTSTRDNDERVTVGEITAAVQDSEAPGEHLIPDSFETFWPKLVVIVIDKDMGELRLLEEVSGVRVILCHFHLKKYTRTEMAKAEYGRPASFD